MFDLVVTRDSPESDWRDMADGAFVCVFRPNVSFYARSTRLTITSRGTITVPLPYRRVYDAKRTAVDIFAGMGTTKDEKK